MRSGADNSTFPTGFEHWLLKFDGVGTDWACLEKTDTNSGGFDVV